MKLTYKALLMLCVITLSINLSWSSQVVPAVYDIQQRWASFNYSPESNIDAAVEGLELLSEEVEALVETSPNNVDIKIWSGIVLSTLANKKGGLGALGLVKQAKARLESAIEQDPEALHGSAYASLGVLYHKVPGWPLGFGSDKLARKNLEAALGVDSQGLDTNFFYADFLADAKETNKAIEHLEIALQAPQLEGRPVADAGRRNEVNALLKKLRDK